ncbi:tRNA pseudouridine(38-40) synthase TruA [Marinilongibacter aquaticus]|uniref:tRNA pseudouridine(38-40) synthase TruA n=1 Tax=Marinilongibacter aquaticus TaxID=2975157 RepID=UPI0021BD9D2E|nr:tRNA pseudouridine(38-40) synthase TruA [Marinilongibacter aquaticus]UBM59413.1 tRNA pseudouridine(38-40) synthase TruA [Marinilongibacter aquaticus]
MRYIIELSYAGTHYHGWQRQPNALSVQEELEKAFSTLLKTEMAIQGSSRTDTGVHARQQYAHFDYAAKIEDPEHLSWKLNSFLPKDIAVLKIHAVPETYHTRFDALARKYIYRLHLRNDPFLSQFSLLFKRDVNLDEMNKACEILKKHTDFESFSKVKTDVNTFECVIQEAFWEQNGHEIHFHIRANRFLRGMVRALVGTILEIGLGKMSIEEFENVLLAKDRRSAGRSVEAYGLTLEQVIYPDNYFEHLDS